MSERFGALHKWKLAVQWASASPALNRTELRVLVLLLNHCNPQSRRCDPSMNRLASLLGVSRRSVQSAINELCKRGVIAVHQNGCRQSNQYDFLSPVEDARRIHPSDEKSAAQSCEASFQQVVKATSHKKIKEKKKKRGTVQSDVWPGGKVVDCSEAENSPGTAKHHKLFLDDVENRLTRKSLDTRVLVEIDSCIHEDAYEAFCKGTTSRSEAIDLIVSACLTFVERHQ